MYQLYYWPGLPGRGEFVRLILEQAGATYVDIGREQGVEPILALRNTTAGFAPPYLTDGELTLAQVTAICVYLGNKHELMPKDIAAAAKVTQMLLNISDVVSEVHDTHHPISVAMAYEEQRLEAKKRAAGFVNGRLKQWLEHFSNVLGEQKWIQDNTLSIADLCLFQLMEGLAYAFPKAFASSVPSNLLKHRKCVAKLPHINSYLSSERRQAFNETGIFRQYPELDIS